MPTRNICVLHKSHPLARNSKIDVEQLKTESLIFLNRERAVRHEMEAIFYRAGLRRRPAIEAHSVGCGCALAAEGIGISIVSELLGA